MLNSNTLNINQIFKNYKELCKYLEEPIYQGGKQRQLQLKNWERYFSYTKQGQKFIITNIYNTPKEKIDNRGGNNNKNIKSLMDYLISEFDIDYINKYFTISNWSTSVLHLVSKENCNVVYKDEKEVMHYCELHNISDTNFFRTYVGTVKHITKNLITTAFRGLQKRGLIAYEEGYSFRYEGAGKHRNICISDNTINEYIEDKEREICEQLINEYFPNKKIKGKQLVYILQHSDKREILKLYNELRMKAINDSDYICCAINDAIMDRDANYPACEDFVDGTDGCRILSYYKCYKITFLDETYRKESNKQDVINVIQMLAIRHMKNIKYKNSRGEIYFPYDNEEYLYEIEKINRILFKNDFEKIIKNIPLLI